MTTALQSVHAEFSDTHPFSLFEGDFVSRTFAALGMGSYRTGDLVKQSLFLIGITWVPLALLAIVAEVHWIQPPGQNFFWTLLLTGSCSSVCRCSLSRNV